MPKMIRKFLLLSIMLCLVIGLLGCQDSEEVKREIIPSLTDKFITETQKAIDKKDGKLARDIWSNVTECSIKAGDYGDQELSEAIKILATTYVQLIEYCETEEDAILKTFNQDFEKALESIKSIGEFS